MQITVQFTVDFSPGNLYRRCRNGFFSPSSPWFLALLSLALLAAPRSHNELGALPGQSALIEKIGNFELTVPDFDRYYAGQVRRTGTVGNFVDEDLNRLVCGNYVSSNQIFAGISSALQPVNSYERYRELRITQQAAIQDGFARRPEVRAMLDVLELEALSEFYLNHKMSERLRFSAKEISARCVKMRKETPDRVNSLPLEQCERLAHLQLRAEKSVAEMDLVREAIRNQVKIVSKRKYDPARNPPAYYRELKKTGACQD